MVSWASHESQDLILGCPHELELLFPNLQTGKLRPRHRNFLKKQKLVTDFEMLPGSLFCNPRQGADVYRCGKSNSDHGEGYAWAPPHPLTLASYAGKLSARMHRPPVLPGTRSGSGATSGSWLYSSSHGSQQLIPHPVCSFLGMVNRPQRFSEVLTGGWVPGRSAESPTHRLCNFPRKEGFGWWFIFQWKH